MKQGRHSVSVNNYLRALVNSSLIVNECMACSSHGPAEKGTRHTQTPHISIAALAGNDRLENGDKNITSPSLRDYRTRDVYVWLLSGTMSRLSPPVSTTSF